MPFCESCAKYLTPTAMKSDGSCPTCGRVLAVSKEFDESRPGRRHPRARIDVRALAATSEDADVSAPWHFKLLVVGLVLYLGWRVVDLFL